LTLARGGPIPVVVGVDVEPDGLGADPSPAGPWPGALATHRWLSRERDRIEQRTGRPVHLAWFLRMDHQVAELFGSSTYVLDAHADLVEDVQARGDAIGLHLHGWRRSPRGGWVEALADDAWYVEGLDGSYADFEAGLGRPCLLNRFGQRFLGPAGVARLVELGVRTDMTAEPGTIGMPQGSWSYVEGDLPDFRRTPRSPHRLGTGLVELPLTASRKPLGLHPKAHLSRMRRHGIFQRLDHPVQFGREAPAGGFGPMLRRSLRAQRRPYLAFAIRSDGILDPVQRPRLLRHLDALLGMAEAERFAFMTPEAALEALGAR
jgi:hypothetical protein